MNPAQLIADLDAALSRTGRMIMVRRWEGNGRDAASPKIEAVVKASIRPAKPDQLIGDVNQAQQRVVLSPTGLAALLPLRSGDKIMLSGEEKAIEGKPEPIFVGDQVVRIELTVLG